MTQPDPNTIEQTERLYGALSGAPTRLTRSIEELLAGVGPDAPVLVEVPWGEVRGVERHDRHQIILTRVEANRVHFINALKTPGVRPGDTLGGPDKGPLRRFEANGEESMPLVRFKDLFQQGGQAMLT